MTYKAIIFDLDGTLIDTLEDIGNAVNRVLTERAFPPHPMDAYRYFVGDGSAMLVRRALPVRARVEETITECFEAFLEEYGKTWKEKTRPYDGIPELLDALTEKRLKLAVLSNKPHELTKRCVSELLANWRFDAVLGQRDQVPKKPDPAGALEVAERLHVPPKQFLFIGDSAVDIKTAIGAAMFPVGVLWGFRPAEELKENGAQALVSRPQEVLNLLGFQ